MKFYTDKTMKKGCIVELFISTLMWETTHNEFIEQIDTKWIIIVKIVQCISSGAQQKYVLNEFAMICDIIYNELCAKTFTVHFL